MKFDTLSINTSHDSCLELHPIICKIFFLFPSNYLNISSSLAQTLKIIIPFSFDEFHHHNTRMIIIRPRKVTTPHPTSIASVIFPLCKIRPINQPNHLDGGMMGKTYRFRFKAQLFHGSKTSHTDHLKSFHHQSIPSPILNLPSPITSMTSIETSKSLLTINITYFLERKVSQMKKKAPS
ncbi:hypothetical protein EYC84_005669 [Monilinia fructicola]|uniref:Uncharacterized protein n=1 Tax=Monilinia fructicola TaxID=38448 RepID=A0A5M9JX65_MONFR|nr:hypothetical protein EYC84_005669 [Monilinia fructicola]